MIQCVQHPWLPAVVSVLPVDYFDADKDEARQRYCRSALFCRNCWDVNIAPSLRRGGRMVHPAMLATEFCEALGLDPRHTKAIDIHIAGKSDVRVVVEYAMDRQCADAFLRVFRSVDFKEQE